MIKQHRFWIWLLVTWLGFAPWAAAIESADLLPSEQAFRLSKALSQTDAVLLSWDIAAGYHLYRHRFGFVSHTQGIEAGEPALPRGQVEHDKAFGDVEIYRGTVEVRVPLRRPEAAAETLDLEVAFQGCADEGACYRPQTKVLKLDLPAKLAVAADTTPFVSEQDRVAGMLANGSLGFTALSFLGFGLLLAFTPCVFPMIPIISGIVIGQGTKITTRRAFGLCLSYVLASSATYTVFGVLAGLFGSNLQALFQEPAVIVAVSGLFVLLALSMFGAIQLQMPAFVQTRLFALSAKQRGGQYWGAAVMGTLSTLAIGPCVTAPLAGTLIYIGQTGNALLGGVALFSLGLGMGIPLLVVGMSAGKLLPKAGTWLNSVKAVFGLGLLAVALWMLDRILTDKTMALLWTLLAMLPLAHLGRQRLWKGAAALGLTYAVIVTGGVATGHRGAVDTWLCSFAQACEKPPVLAFQRVASAEDLQKKLAEAQAAKRWVMLDYYADWCMSCHELEQSTFADARVRSALVDVLLLQVDVTANTVTNQSLLQQYGLIGPPAILFFGPDGQEQKSRRLVGYVEPQAFLDALGPMISR